MGNENYILKKSFYDSIEPLDKPLRLLTPSEKVKINGIMRDYYFVNREHIIEAAKKYNQTYYKKNKLKILEKQKIRREHNNEHSYKDCMTRIRGNVSNIIEILKRD